MFDKSLVDKSMVDKSHASNRSVRSVIRDIKTENIKKIAPKWFIYDAFSHHYLIKLQWYFPNLTACQLYI
jgi:hypothetical protein